MRICSLLQASSVPLELSIVELVIELIEVLRLRY